MTLEQFKEKVVSSDLIYDQFGFSTTHTCVLGGPVLANFRCDLMPYKMPGFNALTAEEVCDQLLIADKDRAALAYIGNQFLKFSEKYLSPKRMAQHLLNRCGLK